MPCWQDFPIGEEKLIELAKRLHETGTGVKDDSLLAPDFRSCTATSIPNAPRSHSLRMRTPVTPVRVLTC